MFGYHLYHKPKRKKEPTNATKSNNCIQQTTLQAAIKGTAYNSAHAKKTL
jgi:hypothetical protein